MIKWLTRPADYMPVWQEMRAFTAGRGAATPDEVWLCEHAPVYTLGQAGKPEHLLNPGAIPVVMCDRGGQITYHGPGQVVAYTLFDLRRAGLYVREYVRLLEDAAIGTLAEFGIATACRKPGAPGVYVPQAPAGELAKIAALGIKIRNGYAYHGVALNVDMDLAPFLGINPCGYAGMATIDMAACGARAELAAVGQRLAERLLAAVPGPADPTR
ncbi:lipoyl(octanoyl) transferase LipB [Bordetella petrii]|nr:lipoyl(octanoyl) transferase LipB [Bordetella petrii]